MKIRFDNNSVSGVARKYRDFEFGLPGNTTKVIDVPGKYVTDIITHLNYRHPAVICTPVEEEQPDRGKTENASEQAGTDADPIPDTCTSIGKGDPEEETVEQTNGVGEAGKGKNNQKGSKKSGGNK